MEIKHSSFIRWDRGNQAIDPSKGFEIRDVNVFIFLKNDRFIMKTMTKNRKRNDHFFKVSFLKIVVSLTIVNGDPSITIVIIIVNTFLFSKTIVFLKAIVFKNNSIKTVANRFLKNDLFQKPRSRTRASQ